MREQLITFETAKLAEEKGFNLPIKEKVLLGSKKGIKTKHEKGLPTQSLLQKWLYKKHHIWVNAQPLFSANEQIGVHLTITSWKFPSIIIEEDYQFDVYKGLEQLLQEALKLIKLCPEN